MKPAKIVKGAAHLTWTLLALPWRAVKSNINQLRKAKQAHKDNIVYIRALYDQATHRHSAGTKRSSVTARGFEEAMRDRPPGAPSIEQLSKRFLRQKRLALGTCLLFAVLSLIAIARGNLLGIATLLACLPLFFMAALSAQLRLWQLRTRRLSREEGGGLHDFIRTPRWYFAVLDPELSKTNGKGP